MMEDLQHPLKTYRLLLGLTQQQLADKVAVDEARFLSMKSENIVVSEQWIFRMETAMVNPTLNFTPVCEVLSDELASRFDPQEVKSHLAQVTLEMLDKADRLDYHGELPVDTHLPSVAETIVAQIKTWYLLLRADAKHRLGEYFRNGTPPVRLQKDLTLALTDGKKDTVYAFCKELGLHPYTVQMWVKNDYPEVSEWPEAIRHALREIGVL